MVIPALGEYRLLHAAREETQAAQVTVLASQQLVPIKLEGSDLIQVPVRRHWHQGLGHGALGVAGQDQQLAPDGLVHRQNDLLNR